MPATVTLSTTTLTSPVGASDTRIRVASTSGLTTGIRLFLDGEQMSVVSLQVDPWVLVLRGVDGTKAAPHASGETIFYGRADQFYTYDPVGRPPEAIPVSPHINVIAGTVWYARGDTLPEGNTQRWWQQVTTTHGIGALGVRTTESDPTSSD